MSNKDITVYMIGNAHIDPVWMWRWQEGFAEVLATCRSALDRMNEYPDFVFTRADAATYRWIEDSCPNMFEQIRQRVREGRWSVVGGWWEQPDCNIPSAESFVRHALYGKRYFADRFGIDVSVGYNVDSFGHGAGLPQILAKAGIKYYVFMRPEPHEMELPDSMFWWEAPDGSRVLAFRLHGPYCTWFPDIADHVNASVRSRPAGCTAAACFYGVGNHGGGPTVENIECIRRMQADPEAPNVVFGTLEQFFEHVLAERSEFPVVRGDLQHHAVGCYTAHSGIKQLNRRAENALVTAEKACAIAGLDNGRAFPAAEFASAWQKVLFNQFHDILAGTSVDAAYEDARDSIGSAVATADYHMATALQSIACRVDTSGEGDPFVVFNLHPHTVRCTVYFDENGRGLRDGTGRDVPVQTAAEFFERTWRRERRVFVDEIPPLGYRTYYSGDWETAAGGSHTVSAAGSTLQSDLFGIEVDANTGRVIRITDERQGWNVLAAPAGPIVLEDPSDTWSHGIVSFDRLAGHFADASVEVVEQGPVRATLRVESRFGGSAIWQDISLYAQLPIIEFRVTVDWRELHRMLKFEFPLNLRDPAVTYDAACAVGRRPADGAENPAQKWVDVSGTNGEARCGVSLINDCKYGFDVRDSVLRLSALRSPVYAFHEPRQVEEGKRYRYMDQGLHSFTFALLPHNGCPHEAGTVGRALVMNAPPVVVETSRHGGTLPPKWSFGGVSAANVDVCAVKRAEDDDALIVRLFETSGRPTQTVLELGGVRHAVSLSPFELKTLRIEGKSAVEADLLEIPH